MTTIIFSVAFVTPRLHLAYAPDDFTMLKVSAGHGARTANILADNSYLLASANSVYVNDKLLAAHPEELDRLDMEKAWKFRSTVEPQISLVRPYTEYQPRLLPDELYRSGRGR